MTSMACLAQTLQTLFSRAADDLAVECGVVQRRRKLTGGVLARTLVFGVLDAGTATLRQLQQLALLAGVPVSVQAIAQRCGKDTATFLHRLLGHAAQTLITGHPVAVPLLQRFPAVVVMDSTTITLPTALRSVWQGCGGSTPEAAAAVLKVQLRLDLCRGGIDVLDCENGKASDQKARSQTAPLPPGALRLSDQGFFAVPVFRAVVAAGDHFLSRPVPRLTVQVAGQGRSSLGHLLAAASTATLDCPVVIGGKEQLACRLIAVRVPAAIATLRCAKEHTEARHEGRPVRAAVVRLAPWTVALTSLAPDQLTVAEALVLLRLRWQVELVFKRWKSAGVDVAHWRTADPWRTLCLVYAKLLACLVEHWVAAVTCWEIPDKSLDGALRTIRGHARQLVRALPLRRRIAAELAVLATLISATCHLQRRRRRPASFQLLLDPEHLSLS